MPSHEEAPRPTASRITRVWLPGRRQAVAPRGAAGTRMLWRAAGPRGPDTCRPDAAPRRAPRNRLRRRDRRATRPPATTPAQPARSTTTTAVTTADPIDRAPASSARRGGGPANEQQRLHAADLQQRHEREQQRHQQTDAERPARRPTTSSPTSQATERVRHGLRNRNKARPPSATPEQRCRADRAAAPAAHRSRAPAGRGADTFQDRDARIFCRTKTRVTLHTPMPPSTTITKPTRLR